MCFTQGRINSHSLSYTHTHQSQDKHDALTFYARQMKHTILVLCCLQGQFYTHNRTLTTIVNDLIDLDIIDLATGDDNTIYNLFFKYQP